MQIDGLPHLHGNTIGFRQEAFLFTKHKGACNSFESKSWIKGLKTAVPSGCQRCSEARLGSPSPWLLGDHCHLEGIHTLSPSTPTHRAYSIMVSERLLPLPSIYQLRISRICSNYAKCKKALSLTVKFYRFVHPRNPRSSRDHIPLIPHPSQPDWSHPYLDLFPCE